MRVRSFPLSRSLSGDILDRRQQHVEQTLFRVQFRFFFNLVDFLFADHVYRNLRQVAHHGFDIASHVAHFGELGRFNFQKRGVCQPRKSARDFSFAHAGRPDHDDILGRDLLGHLLVQFLTADAVAQGNRHGFLRCLLSHDVPVELLDDLSGRHFIQTASFVFAPL